MKNKLIELLTENDGYVSGQAIAERLGVSRQAVWKAINTLREQGISVDSVPNKGYRISSLPEYINYASIKSRMNTKIIGKNLVVLDSVGSTNDYLKQLGNDGCESGTVVTTREQVSGKGRLGRGWQSKRDENITFSFLLRPKMAPYEVSAVTPLAGLAVCKALRSVTGLDCRIKWPNDIVVGKKKLSGILTEMSAEFDAVEYIITGIGINVDQTGFPEEIAFKATSILAESGKRFDKNEILARVLERIEAEFIGNNLTLSPSALREYSSLCVTLGRSVGFARGGKAFNGTAKGVAENGELIAELENGETVLINSGEVTVQGIY